MAATIYFGKDAEVYREAFAKLAQDNRRTTAGELRVALERHLASYGYECPAAK